VITFFIKATRIITTQKDFLPSISNRLFMITSDTSFWKTNVWETAKIFIGAGKLAFRPGGGTGTITLVFNQQVKIDDNVFMTCSDRI